MEDEFFFHHCLPPPPVPPSHSPLSSISLTLSLPPSYLVNYSLALEAQCVWLYDLRYTKKENPSHEGRNDRSFPPRGWLLCVLPECRYNMPRALRGKCSLLTRKCFHTTQSMSFLLYIRPRLYIFNRPGTGLTRTQNLYVGERLSNDVCFPPPHAQWATHRETRQTRTTEVDWKHDSVRGMRRASLPAAGLVGIGSTENAPPPLPPTTKENGKRHTGRANRCGPLQNSLLGALFWSFLRVSLNFLITILTNDQSRSLYYFHSNPRNVLVYI